MISHKALWPCRLGNYFVCKRFAAETLLFSLEVVIYINLEHDMSHDTIPVWNLARSWSIYKQIFIPVKVSFFWKGVQQCGLIVEMMIQKNLKDLEIMEVFITSHVRVFLAINVIAIYILLEMQRWLLLVIFMRKL